MSKKKATYKEIPKNGKIPVVQQDFTKRKIAASSSGPDSITDLKPNWKFDLLDLECPWGFTKQGSKQELVGIIEKLKNFENQTWAEIDRNKKNNHSSHIKEMARAARKRLEDLKIDAQDQETLYALRLNGKERIWGIKEGPDFHFLWWDPEHEVYPSKKKHT